MKKPKSVADAEAVVAVKVELLAAARDAVKQLEREHGEATAAVRQAQEAADATLPQCRLVRIPWRASKEEDIGRVVIVRKTPSGMLVARRVGDASGKEYKFKWAPYAGQYRQAEKRSSFTSDARGLRDVPAEYQHAGQAA